MYILTPGRTTNLHLGRSDVNEQSYAVSQPGPGRLVELSTRIGEEWKIPEPRRQILQAMSLLHDLQLREGPSQLGNDVDCQVWCERGQAFTELDKVRHGITYHKEP